MNSGVGALSDRERETLRLLLQGHDAKSIARELDLSVHTINERLREARRKLGASSSREAARMLAGQERADPEFLVDKQIGVAAGHRERHLAEAPDERRGARPLGRWLIGGSFIVSLIIAAVLLSSALADRPGSASPAASAAASASTAEDAATRSARAWVAMTDAGRWEQSWQSAGTLFKSQVTAAQWAATVEPVRKPLGAVQARTLKSTAKHKSLPGVPEGEYEIVEFNTGFANAKATVETVVLARESSGWKVVGYFIRPSVS